MRLQLRKMPKTVQGIYGPEHNSMPQRMRFLHPDAARSYLTDLVDVIVVSDMFRTAEASLRAKRDKRGAQRPGYSGHNYGFSIDLDISDSKKGLGVSSKKDLDLWMNSKGWWCHRRDHRNDFEAWHYNYFGAEFDKFVNDQDGKTSKGLERKITAYYGRWWHNMEAKDVQRLLDVLNFYKGNIDGDIGPLSRTAIRAFQRAWLLQVDGVAGTMTKRTLCYVTHEKVLVEHTAEPPQAPRCS